MNSDLSVQSFSVALPAGASPFNIGFHDLDYHSGEPFDGTDWTPTVATGAGPPPNISWATQTYAENQNANALRWGTLYNFRFDLDQRLTHIQVTLEPFKPGGQTVVLSPGYQLAVGSGSSLDRIRLLQPG